MLTATELDGFARRYYLASDISDHRIENRIQRDGVGQILSRIPASARVLELGTFDGILTEALQAGGIGAELLEGSPLLCAEAAARHPGLCVHQALFETFTAAAPYDVVLALHVLEHVDDPPALLARMRSWLAPGGRVVLMVPNRESLHRRVALSMGLIEALDELSPRDHMVGHRRVYGFDTLCRDVAAAGLVPGERFGTFLKVLPNRMMLDHSDALLTAIGTVSAALPPELLANIGLVATAPG
jgi:SAM-dependent methyltransferase